MFKYFIFYRNIMFSLLLVNSLGKPSKKSNEMERGNHRYMLYILFHSMTVLRFEPGMIRFGRMLSINRACVGIECALIQIPEQHLSSTICL